MDDENFGDENVAQAWIKTVEAAGPRDSDIYPRLKTWINHTAPVEILEIGCGQGICSDKIDLAGRHYTGLEPSPFLVERARDLYRGQNRRFVLGSAYSMPFPNEAFGGAFAVAVWHLLSDLKTAAQELSRILKADGHFLLITANPASYSLWTDRYAESRLNDRRFEGTMRLHDNSATHDVLYLHTHDEIRNSLRAADLAPQEAITFRTQESKGIDYYISIQGQKHS